jgi:hypothetical protein
MIFLCRYIRWFDGGEHWRIQPDDKAKPPSNRKGKDGNSE